MVSRTRILKLKKLIAMTFVKVNNPIGKSFDGLMNELFNELPASFGKTMREDVLNFPPVNIVEKGENYHLQLSAPGFEKADFNIKLDGKLLTIRIQRGSKMQLRIINTPISILLMV